MRLRTPTVLQMEAIECGAASLAMVLGFYGRYVPLEEMREACGVSRDGSKASNIVKAARKYGLTADGYRKEPEDLKSLPLPMIVFWNFNHFVVLEGFRKGSVYINDPASGPRVVTEEEFDRSFTGIALIFEPGPDFKKGGKKPAFLKALRKRLSGSGAILLFTGLTALSMVIPGLVLPALIRSFIDNYLVQGMDDWIKPLLYGMTLTFMIRASLTWIQQYYLSRFETKLAVANASKFLWHMLRLPVGFFTRRYGSEISSRVALNDKVAESLSGQLITAVMDVATIVFYAAVMFCYDAALTLIAISGAVLNFIAMRFVSQRLSNESRMLQKETGKLIGTALEGLQSIETLKATGTESHFFSRWAGCQANVANVQQRLGRSSLTIAVIPPLLLALNNVAILSIGGLKVMDGYLTMGMLVAFQSLMSSFLQPVKRFVYLESIIREVEGDMNKIDDVFINSIDRYVEDEKPEEDSHIELKKLSGYLTLRDVTFGYGKLEPPLIKNFNLSLKPSGRIALVGPSGCGKSTVAKLICGLYEPWEGEILFDGISRLSHPRRVLTDSIALVDQDIFLFEGTVRENLTLWDPIVAESIIYRAAKDAFIHEEIVARAGGYDGLIEEGGRNFSGGQRQRLEIARALVVNPTILVLDEATSSLDTKTEKIIDNNLRRRGYTCVIVAHRLTTIRDCDEIIVLDRGEVVQRGSHEELKDMEGLYSQLIKA